MRSPPAGCVLVAAALLLPSSAPRADATADADRGQEIILRCHYYMGEFGVDGVQACVDEEQRAMKALSAYPQEASEIVSRCAPLIQESGWAMAKVCVDQDIEAEHALARYPKKTGVVVQGCRERMGQSGAAKVKACVDRELGTPQEGR